MKKLLFIYAEPSTFIRKDIDILKEEFDVYEYHFRSNNNKLKLPILLLKQMFYHLFNFNKFDLIVCQFGAYHSFIPALFSNLGSSPFLIIAGGSDCNSFPSLDYGNLQRPILKTFTALSFKLATHIAPKHISLISYYYQYTPEIPVGQGLKELIPGLKTPHTVIYNGYDASIFSCNNVREENTFITIAVGIEEERTAILKGIDLIYKMAAQFPEYKFIIVGNDVPKDSHASNLIFIPKKSFSELLPLLCNAEYYFQLSMSEGFPNALCEAMLSGCIPIGSNVNSIPEIIGETGFILNKKNEEELIHILKKLKDLSQEEKNILSQKAKIKISENYPIEKRKASLLELAKKLS